MKYYFKLFIKHFKVVKNSNVFISTISIMCFLVIITYLISDTKIVQSVNFEEVCLNDNINFSNNTVSIEGNNKAKIYMEDNEKILDVNVEDYVIGVVASEMPINFNEEALKAQAVAARTYYYSKRLENCTKAHGGEICSSTHCQVYMNKEDRLNSWPKDKGEEYWDRAVNAVNSTKDEVLTYNGKIIMHPQFFAVSSGKTESFADVFSEDIPYLKSIESLGEDIAPKYKSNIELSLEDFTSKVNNTFREANLKANDLANEVRIISNTDGGSVKKIKLGDVEIKGTDFRKLFNLNSANFNVSINKSRVVIDCTGYGHGVGMSQWGARVMADKGADYKEILKHYYTGIEIKKIKYY